MHIIRRSSFRAVPWKNGGGITHEVIRMPAIGDPFRWRVSVARIEVSGAFSDFAGYTRLMVLLQGGGVSLRFSSGETRVLRAVGDRAGFDGALGVECSLLSGPCMDFNLIAAKSLGEVTACVSSVGEPLSLVTGAGRSTLVFPIDASVDLQVGGEAAALGPWDLAVIAGDERVGRLQPREPQTPARVILATLDEA